MAKMFYSAKEAAAKLGSTEEAVKALAREGKLREFRDAGSFNYKVSDVDALAAPSAAKAPSKPAPPSFGGSQSGEIVLEPVEDSSVELAPSGSDVVTLEGAESEDTAAGTRVGRKAKEGSSIPSVGVNVFDDDELDEHVDPLAQTAISDVAGLGLEGVGGGSGILDLTRESDDTSLGAELLEDIYSAEEGGEGKDSASIGEDTRAGLDQAPPKEGAEAEGVEAAATAETSPAATRVLVAQALEFPPDAVSSSLTALLVVAIAVMWIGGLGAASLVRGATPGILETVYSNLALFAGGSLLLGGGAAGVVYFLAKRAK